MKGLKVLIIGGVAGGASAAARLRRLDESARIIMFERGEHISYANCGLPYYVGEVIKDREELIVQTPEGMGKRFNIDIRVKNEVVSIDIDKREIEVRDIDRKTNYRESFDKLILSPGAQPIKPPIPGIDGDRVFTLRSVPDTFAIKEYMDYNKPGHALIVGGGFIGLEMAENIKERGISVTVVEMADQVMAPLDEDMAAYVHEHLKNKDIDLILGDGVKSITHENQISNVYLQSGREIKTNMIIMSIGVRPETNLARDAGLRIGERGGIRVNSHLQTSNPNIYAIGDAIEVVDLVNGQPTLIPLAGPANKQGRIVANHIVGIDDTYKATQGTSIVKLFDMTVASTGNNEKTLKRCNIQYLKSYTHSGSHAGYYPGAKSMAIKLLFAPDKGRVLGAQIVGSLGVDKRIDVLATALRAGMTVYDLQELELAYAPPFSSAKDPVNMAGYVAANIINGHHPVTHWNEIDDKDMVLVDTRTEREHRMGAIPGSINIPLDMVRQRMDELPRDKRIVLYCQVGTRGYFAQRFLLQNGFSSVTNLSGGYKTWKVAVAKETN